MYWSLVSGRTVSLLPPVSLFVGLTPDRNPRSSGVGDLPTLASPTQRHMCSPLPLIKMVPTTEKQRLSNYSKKQID